LTAKKTAARNGNLQPEIEINEYSSSKKSTRVAYYSSTRGSPSRKLDSGCHD